MKRGDALSDVHTRFYLREVTNNKARKTTDTKERRGEMYDDELRNVTSV
jgi:hypothetical protein